MIKRFLLISNQQLDTIDNIKFSISWKQKSDLVNEISKFIKSKELLEFYPKTPMSYVTIWNVKESYDNFINNQCYIDCIELLKSKGIDVVWSEMED